MGVSDLIARNKSDRREIGSAFGFIYFLLGLAGLALEADQNTVVRQPSQSVGQYWT